MNAASMEKDAELLDEFAEVESSNLAGAGTKGEDLIVFFRAGAAYLYPCAAELLHPLLASESKGRFFNSKIRRVPGYVRLCSAPGCTEPVLKEEACAVHRGMTSDG